MGVLCSGEGLLAEEEAAPGRLAFLLFIQLEAEAADDALLSQATKNLVFLAPRLLATDAAAGRVPAAGKSVNLSSGAIPGPAAGTSKIANGAADAKSGTTILPCHCLQRDCNVFHNILPLLFVLIYLIVPRITQKIRMLWSCQSSNDCKKYGGSDRVRLGFAGAAGGPGGADVADDDADLDADLDDDIEEAAEGEGRSALTLHGLVRRMARLADDRAWPRQAARLAALRFAAALGSRLGKESVVPYLPSMLLPLYRITESNATNSDEVRAFFLRGSCTAKCIPPFPTMMHSLVLDYTCAAGLGLPFLDLRVRSSAELTASPDLFASTARLQASNMAPHCCQR